jgi:hypothetical protein
MPKHTHTDTHNTPKKEKEKRIARMLIIISSEEMYFLFVLGLGGFFGCTVNFEPRTSHLLGRCSTT